jgi:hypothetical protein
LVAQQVETIHRLRRLLYKAHRMDLLQVVKAVMALVASTSELRENVEFLITSTAVLILMAAVAERVLAQMAQQQHRQQELMEAERVVMHHLLQ